MGGKSLDVVLENKATAALAGESMGAWLAALREWSYFLTLTYDPVKVLARRGVSVERSEDYEHRGLPVTVGLQKLRKDVQRFVVEVGLELGGVDLAAGFEPHHSGSLHAHALLRPMTKGTTKSDIRAVHAAWYGRNGAVLVDVLDAAKRAAADYVLKFDRVAAYTTKGRGDFFFSHSLNAERAAR